MKVGLICIFVYPDDSWRTLTGHSSTSTVQTGNTDYWSNTFSSVLDSNSKAGNNTSFLWGSNAIWEPWQPPVESPVRRTPPGFDEQIQKRREVSTLSFLEYYARNANTYYRRNKNVFNISNCSRTTLSIILSGHRGLSPGSDSRTI